SIETLQNLLTRYPETLHRLDAYYQLYLSYISLNDAAKAEEYKNKIINEFSQSKYALALSDPDYINRQLSEEQQLDQYYQEVYDLVEDGAYEEAQEKINLAKQRFGTTHALQPKFAILEAMCTGHSEGREAYVGALKAIIGTYPNTPEETKARDMLLLLGEYQGNRLNLARGNDISGPSFKPSPDALHFMLVMVHNQDDEELNTRDLKISVSEYNKKYHQLDRLKISSLVFDPASGQSLILVRSFKNAERAMQYFRNVEKYRQEFLQPGAQYDILPQTQHNYREIIRQKSLDDYKAFFDEHYSNI
ncbi:MAG: hypothetical protein R3330_04060, partial [Saprospiraceae bacterium]|nr:hypothetical protein [Saprospiraceae bacterium]